MCLSKVYRDDDTQQEPLAQEVVSVDATEDGKLLLRTIFGQQTEIQAQIKSIDLQNGRIILKNAK